MKNKRSRMEIVHDMLNLINNKKGKIKPTHLMYKANLSYKQMDGYLKELIKNQLIEKSSEKNRQIISMTKKGQEFLLKFAKLREFENTFGL